MIPMTTKHGQSRTTTARTNTLANLKHTSTWADSVEGAEDF